MINYRSSTDDDHFLHTDVASLCFRYRHWKLGDDIDLVVRCEHDGVMTGANGEVSFVNIKTLNEWDSRVRGRGWWLMFVTHKDTPEAK